MESDDDKKEIDVCGQVLKLINQNNEFLTTDLTCTDLILDNIEEVKQKILSKEEGFIVHQIPLRNETLQHLLENPKQIDTAKEKLEKADWITPSILIELENYYPKKEDISPTTNERCKESFAENCAKLFPKGRIFSSKQQLKQMLIEFSKPWGGTITCVGSKFNCHFGKSTKIDSKKKKTSEPNNIRNRVSKKDIVQCTFSINISFLNRKPKGALPQVFYLCRISNANYQHTCKLSPKYQRQAMKTTGEFMKLDNTDLSHALLSVHRKPRIPTQEIRPLLEEALPNYAGVDGKLVSNFVRRARVHLLKNGPPKHLVKEKEAEEKIKYSDFAFLTSRKPIQASEEQINTNDPFIYQNFKAMLDKILQEDKNTWAVINYLEEVKREVPGFDYRIMKNKKGHPCGVMWMTPEHRKNLIKYGHLLCLDMQLRQFNSSGWPYCGIALFDGENELRLGCECIIFTESNPTYQWILKNMSLIEPRFKLTEIKIIFADQKVTTTLLKSLGIKSTCILHGDYYHLTNFNWPKLFGNNVWNLLHPYLRRFLLSKTEKEYNNAYELAKEKVKNNAKALEKLMKIHQNPKYYGGYVVQNIVGNLGVNGDSQSERNHASVIAYNGQGGTWDIVEQISLLLKREQDQDRRRGQREDSYHVNVTQYTGKNNADDDPDKVMDIEAKKALTQYAYESLFSVALRKKRNSQSSIDEDGNTYIWSANLHFESAKDKSMISPNQRCNCSFRRKYDIECGCELFLHKTFNVSNWNIRWLNCWTFDELYPDASIFPIHNLEYQLHYDGEQEIEVVEDDNIEELKEEENSIGENNDIEIQDCLPTSTSIDKSLSYDEHASDITNNKLATQSSKVSYNTMKSKFDELLSVINNDNKEKVKWFSIVESSINKYRNNQDVNLRFDYEFGKVQKQRNNPGVSTESTTTTKPNLVKGVSKPIANAASMKRKRNIREIKNSTKRKKGGTFSQNEISTDNNHIADPIQKPKSCTVCGMTGHYKYTPCPRLGKYGDLMPRGLNERMKLSTLLCQSGSFIDYVLRAPLLVGVSETFPEWKIGGVVIYKRFLFNHQYVLECTVLNKDGTEREEFSHQFYYAYSLVKQLTSSKDFVIINKLQRDHIPLQSETSYQQTVVALPYATPFFQQNMMLSQDSNNLSQGEDEMSRMGYGET